jgi:hypothetical protein
MVELRMRKREMRGHGGNHHEKLELKRISCGSQFAIPNMAGTSSDPVCINTNTWSSQSNQARCTPNLSYPLVFYTSFSSSFPFLSLSSSTLPSSQNTKLSHPSLFLHAIIISWHWVQTYTEYSIHWVQHPPKIVCLPFSLMITSWARNVVSASGVPPYMIDCHQSAFNESSEVKSSCYIHMVAS